MLGLAAALLLAVFIRAQIAPDPVVKDAMGAEPAPASGMALLEDYRCRPGETRKVVVHGVEDSYAIRGREPSRIHPRLLPRFATYAKMLADYDSRQPDHVLIDWFEVPPNVASAMFVVGFRPLGDNLNDRLTVGDAGPGSRSSSDPPAMLDERQGWNRSADLHWIDADHLRMRSGGTLLDLLRAGAAGHIVDMVIQDDTSVDFSALAWCETPARQNGVTFEAVDLSPVPAEQVAGFECQRNDFGAEACKPFVGDRSCQSPLPMLCFRDLSLPTPRVAVRYNAMSTKRWSGGEVAATEPLKASRFATISDANRYCVARFGQGWRVAEWHEGGVGYGFSARSGGRKFSGRYWVDIRGAPYGTCWTRDHDH